MSRRDDDTEPRPPKGKGREGGAAPDPKAAREARLAEALRANLRRRKARARAAAEDGDASATDGGGDD